MIRELITDLLDVLALLMIAGGMVGGLWPVMGWWAMLGGAVVLIAGTSVASYRSRAEPVTAAEAEDAT